MGDRARKIARGLVKRKRLQSLIEKSGKYCLLPFYHAVADHPPRHLKGLYPVRTVDQFQRDLDFFQKQFDTISLAELIQKKGQFSKPVFHLSFDDGLRETAEVVYPILQERGIVATFFLNTKFVDNQALFFRFKASLLHQTDSDLQALKVNYPEREKLNAWAAEKGVDFNAYLNEERPYLSMDQIKEMQSGGMTFGAHSLDHPKYNQISLEEQVKQTKESMSWIQANFSPNHRVFSFPFTDDGVTTTFFDSIADGFDLTFGCAGIKDDCAPNHLQRLAMEIEGTAEDIVKNEYGYYLLRKRLGKHIISRN